MSWIQTSAWRPIGGKGQNVTIGTASTQCSTAFGSQTRAVLVSCTGNCHVAIGPNPTVTTTDLLLIGPGGPDLLGCAPGDKIAVIGDSGSTGTLNVTEVTY